ncbi:hypothetical protein EI044_25140 [Escherichia coli]|nr:hypothetical protein [Escherichia coli]
MGASVRPRRTSDGAGHADKGLRVVAGHDLNALVTGCGVGRVSVRRRYESVDCAAALRGVDVVKRSSGQPGRRERDTR